MEKSRPECGHTNGDSVRIDTRFLGIVAIQSRWRVVLASGWCVLAHGKPGFSWFHGGLASAQPCVPVEPDVASIQPDVSSLQPDITGVQPDVACLQPNVACVQPDFSCILAYVSGL